MALQVPPSQVPTELTDSALRALEKVHAYNQSHGNPEVMRSFKDPPTLFMLFLITCGLVVVALVISSISNYYEITRNWSHYQCMPSVAPFARFYGHDLAETINFCVSQEVKEHAPGVIDPIYNGINAVAGVVDGVFTKVSAIESGVMGLLKGFQEFVINFVNSFRLLGTRVRMSVIRIKDIFARVYGLFIAFTYAAVSAITFGENLICNPLVVFLGMIAGVDICCFAPDTQIAMRDGSWCPITSVKIGDDLADGSRVTSTYVFDGTRTRMVHLWGVHVSANHYVRANDGTMIQAGEHPAALAAPSLERLWCLTTSDHRIPVVASPAPVIIVFSDYEESSDPAVIAEAQRISERQLNGGIFGPTVPDYSLGLDPSLSVLMYNMTWKTLAQVDIGDRLMGGATVTGIIRELCDEQVKSPGAHVVSAAQLIMYQGRWVRAAHIWSPNDTHTNEPLCHLMVDGNQKITVGGDGETFVVRDYAEINSYEIQAPYDKSLKGVSAPGC